MSKEQLKPKFKVGDMARKPKGYEFPCTIVSVFKTKKGNVRVVGEMDGYGLLHIFNEDQLVKINNKDILSFIIRIRKTLPSSCFFVCGRWVDSFYECCIGN